MRCTSGLSQLQLPIVLGMKRRHDMSETLFDIHEHNEIKARGLTKEAGCEKDRVAFEGIYRVGQTNVSTLWGMQLAQ